MPGRVQIKLVIVYKAFYLNWKSLYRQRNHAVTPKFLKMGLTYEFLILSYKIVFDSGNDIWVVDLLSTVIETNLQEFEKRTKNLIMDVWKAQISVIRGRIF